MNTEESSIIYNSIHPEYFHNKISIIDPDELKKEKSVKSHKENFPMKKKLTEEEEEAKKEAIRKRLKKLRDRISNKNIENKTDTITPKVKSEETEKIKSNNKSQHTFSKLNSIDEEIKKEKSLESKNKRKITEKKIKTHNVYQKEEYINQFIKADETTGLFFNIAEKYNNKNIESFINENNNLFTEFETNDEPININVRSIEAPWNKDNNLIIIDLKANKEIIETINMSFFFNRESVHHYRLIGYESYIFDTQNYNKDESIYFHNSDSSVENVKISPEFTIIFEIQKEAIENRVTKAEPSEEFLYIDMKYTEHTTDEKEYPIEILVKNSILNKNKTEKTKIAAIITAMAHHKEDKYMSHMGKRYIIDKYSLEDIEKEIKGSPELNQNLKLQRLLKTTGRKITFE